MQKTWSQYLDHVSACIRDQVYPQNAEHQVTKGRAAFRSMSVGERGNWCLEARILLRMAIHFHPDLTGIGDAFRLPFQNPATLFAFDDLLQRMSPCLRELALTSRPEVGPLRAARAMQLLNLVLYKAEFSQDKWTGMFQEAD